MKRFGRPAWAWAMNDWGNSAFATTVMGVFFPIMFKQYWSEGVAVTESTFRLGVVNSLSAVAVALVSPVLGIAADRGGARKKLLFFFTALGVAMTAGLMLAAKGQWLAASLLYLFASMGFSGSLTFYDSLLPLVSEREDADMVSSLGYSLGYLGGGLLFALNVAMVSKPDIFGLSGASEAVRASFITVAVWWAVFSIPVFLFVKEPEGGDALFDPASFRRGLGELSATVRDLKGHRSAFLFLAAYWLYIDGVDTIIRMAVDFGMSIGFTTKSLMTAFLVTQFVGFPAAVGFGKLAGKVGTRKSIYLGLAVYVLVVVWAYYMKESWEFYALAVAVGLVQGGVQALSRSYFAGLIPADRSAEFFGFYNMLGKTAAVLGPLLMGVTGSVTGNPRAGIVPVLLLIAGGAAVLYFVPEPDRAGAQ